MRPVFCAEHDRVVEKAIERRSMTKDARNEIRQIFYERLLEPGVLSTFNGSNAWLRWKVRTAMTTLRRRQGRGVPLPEELPARAYDPATRHDIERVFVPARAHYVSNGAGRFDKAAFFDRVVVFLVGEGWHRPVATEFYEALRNEFPPTDDEPSTPDDRYGYLKKRMQRLRELVERFGAR
jgi:hypothetical protein